MKVGHGSCLFAHDFAEKETYGSEGLHGNSGRPWSKLRRVRACEGQASIHLTDCTRIAHWRHPPPSPLPRAASGGRPIGTWGTGASRNEEPLHAQHSCRASGTGVCAARADILVLSSADITAAAAARLSLGARRRAHPPQRPVCLLLPGGTRWQGRCPLPRRRRSTRRNGSARPRLPRTTTTLRRPAWLAAQASWTRRAPRRSSRISQRRQQVEEEEGPRPQGEAAVQVGAAAASAT